MAITVPCAPLGFSATEVEGLEDAGDVGLGDAGAVVQEDQLRQVFERVAAHRYLSALICILD